MSQLANQYNYDTFAHSTIPQPKTFESPQVGQKITDFTATRLDETVANLSEYCRKSFYASTCMYI